MLTDASLPAKLPSHGGNTGSNPVGDAKNINNFDLRNRTVTAKYGKFTDWPYTDADGLHGAKADAHMCSHAASVFPGACGWSILVSRQTKSRNRPAPGGLIRETASADFLARYTSS